MRDRKIAGTGKSARRASCARRASHVRGASHVTNEPTTSLIAGAKASMKNNFDRVWIKNVERV